MKVEIDQSGKIGDTKVPTVLAFSNSEDYAILIPATVKRKCVLQLRRQGKSGNILYLQLFVIGLFLLLKRHYPRLHHIVIDAEYPGHETKIKEQLLNLFHRINPTTRDPIIEFQSIGKHSSAHLKAISAFTGTVPPDKIVKIHEIIEQINKK